MQLADALAIFSSGKNFLWQHFILLERIGSFLWQDVICLQFLLKRNFSGNISSLPHLVDVAQVVLYVLNLNQGARRLISVAKVS